MGQKETIIKNIIVIITISILLISCSQINQKQNIEDARIKQFLAIYPDALMTSKVLTSNDQWLINDFLSTECAIQPPFTRTVYQQYGAKLIIYTKDSTVLCVLSKFDTKGPTIIQGDQNTAPKDVAFIVNEKPILFSQVEAVYTTLPQEQQTVQSINVIIEQFIVQELLSQEASEYEITEEEITTAYENIISNAGVSKEEFLNILSQKKITPDSVLEQLKTNLKIEALLAEKLRTEQINVGDEQTQEFYLTNSEAFIVSEQVKFQQIFVSGKDDEGNNKTVSAVTTKAQTVLESLKEEDFCSVVRQYSDDKESSNTCGTYTIPRGVTNQKIEQTVFSTPINETVIVQTENGVHFIRVLEKEEAKVIPYAQAKEQVRGLIKEQIAQLRLNAYLASIKSEAKVINYLVVQ